MKKWMLIDKNELKEILDDELYMSESTKAAFRSMIHRTHTVDAVEMVSGYWQHSNGKSNLWYCSECGEKILYNEKKPVYEVNKFCRSCGAKMQGEKYGICKED